MTGQAKIVASILALAVAGGLGGGLALTTLVGPSEWGMRCARAPVAQCRIEQTRFFGLLGNSFFSIPESDIRGAKTIAPFPGRVGGRGGVGFTVALELERAANASTYPVLSAKLQSQADAATDRLNAYFRDTSAPSIEMTDDVAAPVLLSGAAPLLLIGAALRLRWRKARQEPA